MSLLVTTLVIPLAYSQPENVPARFDTLLTKAIEQDHIPGSAAVVILGERIQYEKASGLANIETGQPMTADTLFRMSGLSKVTTAATLAALAVEGKLQLDAPIGEQWKTVPAFLSRITLRQLVQDRAGIRDEHVNFSVEDRESLRQYILRWDDKYVIAEPGRFRSHSSAGANLAAAVAEQVAGANFAELLDSSLMRPLGMHLTTLRVLEAMTHPFTQGYIVNGGSPEIVRPFAANWIGWPSSSVFSSARDSAILLGVLINNGRWNGKQLLSERVVRETLSLLELSGDGSFRGGFNWFDGREDFVIVPKRHFAAIYLRNGGTATVNVLAATRAAWLGETPPSRKEPQSEEIGPEEMKRLAGAYWNDHTLQLEVRGGKLYYRDQGSWYLKPSEWVLVRKAGENSYVAGGASAGFIFVKDANGNARYEYADGAEFTAIADANGNVQYLRVGSRVLRRQP
jgi:CubicO group peptidase (beta-lactamase class C family)